MNRIKMFGWQEWLLILGLLLSLVVTVVFAIRAFERVPRARIDEPIRPWMSVPYIAHSYHVPAAVLFEVLGLPARPPDRRPIVQIARAQNRSVEEVVVQLQHAIFAFRNAARPTPAPSPSPTGGLP